MLTTDNQLIRLSQGQLNLLETCPRKFQHTHLEQLNSPSDPDHTDKLTLGSRFHLLMQQQEMGLPIDSFLQADTQLQNWMSGFANAAPEILTPTDGQTFRESEHYRTLQFQDYLLTVIYDLLIADHQQAQILDWKTYPKPPDKRKLAQNWQTRLYMYVLAETSQYSPENISMTYWFVQSQGKPQNIQFTYSQNLHIQTAKKLDQLLGQLTKWLNNYQQGTLFPQVPVNSKACDYCQFAKKCDGLRPTIGDRLLPTIEHKLNSSESNSLEITAPAINKSFPALDAIEEVSL
ncbi:PD-(D/E)XK nuclease family protein [Nostoc parmelioides]|uniref:PD-(D/E)XK nuclease family protein n=1 Tax=Nostoc parmelioides FACHB-3921 TaxID=2692909 RepID=A0ABR8BAV0_9NOSO|nr:PD-(D/E)XK nuclease family protein [Nostoc parmelioides]MBD2250015.1 PD-(D/E)XK nuclease family protein [Nostoc parmelioides FACHB-3921]